MNQKIIKISVDPNGVAKIEADGFKGSECKDATKIYESLYSEQVSTQDKPELYQGASCSVQQINS
jgi:hypothetical protein